MNELGAYVNFRASYGYYVDFIRQLNTYIDGDHHRIHLYLDMPEFKFFNTLIRDYNAHSRQGSVYFAYKEDAQRAADWINQIYVMVKLTENTR